ncbi:Formamidopyrimidine-DNA glycosylase [Candidatus Kinetoplastibacterium sorsogonicusi]|uniref:Formamidopyrimidine-DNA glycosylase n=1 Tax=Candidatus Kinetoplastidibacterium kentomonadis TaxID=1576550 RepID=A0A3S7J989_9PROT|nr:bifunctional DNA-formamidopyrimidine glycosylase/DNA-(apurinic or apyrimidinic site) lyase [Candidatus Kinetoplastibacterium sorsogonicusi]AWD32237.1 Formamidopyrimidine-DNA glycosylase [Candidatus Kinetoplastibacterium sorsogonicusi]
MPELPEVENTIRGIKSIIGKRLNKLIINNYNMRWKISTKLPNILQNQIVLNCQRRGKIILIYFQNGIQLIHLGMSGMLYRSDISSNKKKHDHVEWLFDNEIIRLNDPRRFGYVLWHSNDSGSIELHPRIKNLGIEPFSNKLNAEYLYKIFQKKNTEIKQAIMNSNIIVGIGNIYASEILFNAQINPFKLVKELSLKECSRLIFNIKKILNIAINSGGSSIKNYKNMEGVNGSFIYKYAMVYNLEGKNCKICNSLIIKKTQKQRSTYLCPSCQKFNI